jgi:hypothetical protein
MDAHYAPMLKKHRIRMLWFPILFISIGTFHAWSTIGDSGYTERGAILTLVLVITLAFGYYWTLTSRDVEKTKNHGASVIIDGMADELGREWRWNEEFQQYVMCDVDE